MKRSAPRETIAWSDLSEKERDLFELAFMADNARFARLKLMEEKSKGPRFFFANRLSAHQVLLRQYRKWSALRFQSGLLEVETDIEKHLERFRAMLEYVSIQLKQKFDLCLLSGDWKGLKWLAEYCEQHAPEGIGATFKDVKTSFPESLPLRNPAKGSATLSEVVLWEFVRIVGKDQSILSSDPHFPEGYDHGIDGRFGRLVKGEKEIQPRMRPDLYPVRLPTKKYLQACVENTWEKLKNEPDNLSSDFSRAIKKLGLNGLPKSRPSAGYRV